MKYEVLGNDYNVVIIKKNNRNTYIKVDKELNIIVTTNYFVTQKYIISLLDKNSSFLERIIKKRKLDNEKDLSFYYLGNKYDIIMVSTFKMIKVIDNKIYTKDMNMLNKWLTSEIKRIFIERLDYNYHLFQESIPYPKLKIRSMKTRWGVCNKKDKSVTLNSNLIKYDYECIDYVIIHELSHFIHFNHSPAFWLTVSKYKNNYKEIRKLLKE